MRSMVEGNCARGAGVDNPLNHGIRVSRYVGSGNAQQANSLAGKPLLAGRIQCRPVAYVMSNAVNFDGQPCFAAEEVEHVGSSGVLATEFQASGSKRKPSPEDNFRRAHRASKFARLLYGSWWSSQHGLFPSTMLRMVPLPEQARGGDGVSHSQARAASVPIKVGKKPSCAARSSSSVTV